MQVSFKFRFISTVTNREMINKMMVITLRTFAVFHARRCEKFKEVAEKLAEINRVHYLKHNRKTVRLTKHILITFSFLILPLLEQLLLLSQHVID